MDTTNLADLITLLTLPDGTTLSLYQDPASRQNQ